MLKVKDLFNKVRKKRKKAKRKGKTISNNMMRNIIT